MRKRAARAKKLMTAIRSREYFKAAAEAITIVKGNGGGEMHASTTATAPRFLIILLDPSNLFRPAIFFMPSSPSLPATKASKKTPRVDPRAAATMYQGNP